MSVQVKRRREAAAFLSTFVGAQGELLVDTTNNRVQVHDGVTPGGNPAAGIDDVPGRNVVINGTFAINQRAYASGTARAAGVYAHDRWKAGAGGCAYTFTQGVPDTAITITAGTLVQVIEAANVYAGAWWLTWQGTATARAWQGSASGTFSAGTAVNIAGVAVNALPVVGLTAGTVTAIEFSTGTLGLVQFEAALPNAGPTRFERRFGVIEIALCGRYYQRVVNPGLRGVAYGSTVVSRLGAPLPYPMRATPSCALTGSLPLYNGASTSTATSIATSYSTALFMEFDFNTPTSSFAAGNLILTYAVASPTFYLEFNAEL